MLDIEPVSGTVTVGPREELTIDLISGIRPRWCGTVPAGALAGTVQLRAHGAEHRAVVTVSGDAVEIELLEPALFFAHEPGAAARFADALVRA